jgi:hypothetical protein
LGGAPPPPPPPLPPIVSLSIVSLSLPLSLPQVQKDLTILPFAKSVYLMMETKEEVLRLHELPDVLAKPKAFSKARLATGFRDLLNLPPLPATDKVTLERHLVQDAKDAAAQMIKSKRCFEGTTVPTSLCTNDRCACKDFVSAIMGSMEQHQEVPDKESRVRLVLSYLPSSIDGRRNTTALTNALEAMQDEEEDDEEEQEEQQQEQQQHEVDMSQIESIRDCLSPRVYEKFISFLEFNTPAMMASFSTYLEGLRELETRGDDFCAMVRSRITATLAQASRAESTGQVVLTDRRGSYSSSYSSSSSSSSSSSIGY